MQFSCSFVSNLERYKWSIHCLRSWIISPNNIINGVIPCYFQAAVSLKELNRIHGYRILPFPVALRTTKRHIMGFILVLSVYWYFKGFPFVRTGRSDYARHNKYFIFNQNCLAISQFLNDMHGVDEFQGKHLESVFSYWMKSSACSSNCWKAPLVSIVRSKKEGNRTPKTEQK